MSVNKTLSGRYEILEQIGAGGMAIVYKAKDLLLNRIVTVKVLREQFASDEDFLRRFRREAQAAASLSHPNIVSIYDVGKDGDTEYIVMEYVEGRNLKEIIREYAPMSSEQTIHLARQIGDAICHAHAHHIIHRDIKPHNILITSDGRAKVTDFGIARAVSSATVTHTGNIIGSVHYLSPEQARGVQSNEQSDIYSLGIIMYELLTGKVPYDGETAIAIALKHLQENAVPPRRLNPRISPDLEKVIMRAIAKAPEDRYQSASELLDDLEKVRKGEAIVVPPPVSHPDTGEDLEATQIHKALVPGIPPAEQARMQGERDHNQGPAKKKIARWKIVTGVVAGLLVLLIGGMVWANSYFRTGTTTVPDLKNMTVDQAKDVLKDAGLTLDKNVSSDFSSTVGKDKIMDQQPKADAEVKKGRAITVVVSKGPDQFTMPDLSGMTEDNARKTLENNGFTGPIKIDNKPSTEEVGKVIEQDPQANTPWERDGKVTLTLSAGPSGETFNMPNLIGHASSEGQSTLQNEYGVVPLIETEDSSAYPKGVIIRTEPAPGERVQKGDKVTIVVSRGPGPVGWDNNAKSREMIAFQAVLQPGLQDTGFQDRLGTKEEFYAARDFAQTL